MSEYVLFLAGMATMGFLLAGLFFFRFWWRTQDRLFLAFGTAFLLLALNQCVPILAGIPDEERSWVYLLRLAGFGLLIVAILGRMLVSRKSRNIPPAD